MGPFPHDAPPASIGAHNPVGTDGFEFVEFAHPRPEELSRCSGAWAMCRSPGTAPRTSRSIARATSTTSSMPNRTASRRALPPPMGPGASAMAWRVVDARHAFAHAVKHGAEPYEGTDKTLDAPAIRGIGGSLLYFVDRYGAKGSPYADAFVWLGEVDPRPKGVGFYYLDHLTHNVMRGHMDRWFDFYVRLFGFRQIRYFDIEGKLSGLYSRALTSPCGRIRIPINESADDHSQIEEYLRQYKGEGIQHIAVGTDALYDATDALAANGLAFMPGPPEAYYAASFARVAGHTEPVERMKRHGILIDGEGVVAGGTTKILLQVFSKTVIGPIFFEFIQRKGDDGFGEGNFKALFESIEQDQIARGVLKAS